MLRSAHDLWYHTSQLSQAMPQLDQLASTSQSPHGKVFWTTSGPGFVSISQASKSTKIVSNLLKFEPVRNSGEHLSREYFWKCESGYS